MEIEVQKETEDSVDKVDDISEYYEEEVPEFEGEFDEYVNNGNGGDDFRFNRGGFNRGGRGWGPRFRGRGFGGPPGSSGPPMRGRGQPPQFFRGRGGGRFPVPNFDPNWGPPGMMGPNYGPPPGMNGPPGHFGGPGHFGPPGMGPQHMVQELWVETKTDEGKSYFYHAVSRETTWTRPEGPHIKIMSQSEVEAMNKQQQQMQHQQQQQQQQQLQLQNSEQNDNQPPIEPSKINDNLGNAIPNLNGNLANSTNEMGNKQMDNTQAPPPQQQQQLQQMMPSFSGPPPQYGMSQFGMPPPGFPGNFPSNPWGVVPPSQWSGMPGGTQISNTSSSDSKNTTLISTSKPGEIDSVVITKAAEWTEHRAPDGRPYYYHAARGESIWEKPQAIRDLEAARMAAFANTAPPNSGPAPTATQVALANSSLASAAQQAVPPVQLTQQQQIPSLHNLPPGQQPNVMFDPMGFVMKPQGANDVDETKNEKSKKKTSETDKKKKEEEDEKTKQGNKQQDKSRPISSTPISGTPWCVVWTGDGRVFFYNPSTRTSVWERPEDLLERADVDKAISTPPEQLIATQEEKEPITIEIKKRSESESSEESDEVPAKKMKVEAPAPKVVEKKVDAGKEAAIEAEVRAARERALVPLEIRVKSFKEMLKEKDVSAFSTWEKELHKIVFDPRYLLLTSRERKQVFEKYVKERAEEERREKRNKMRQRRDDFRHLLETINLHGKSSFSEFAQKYGRDDRFKCIEKIRERESLFNEYIVELRKKEKDDKIHKKEQTKKEFIGMLRDHPDIDRHSRWMDIKKKIDSDNRYRAVENSILREDYFHDFCKIMKEEKKKAKETKDREKKDKKKDKDKDKEREKEKEKDKTKDKDSKDKDSKDKDMKEKEKENKSKEKDEEKEKDKNKDSDDKEDGEHAITSEDEVERQQKERDRQMRAELSIKEREKEVQRTLATHLRDRDKEREHHKRDESMRHFSALLADLVRNADLTWKEVKKQLRKDHRWELVETLDRDDRERLFNEHIELLAKKKRDKFREMLEELPKMELTTAWKEIRKLIKDDPRYLKFNSSEKCEREFKEYTKDKTVQAKSSFRELLQESKLITHKSFETVKDNQNNLKEIEDILKNDKRYLVLNHLAYERTQMVMTYLEDLHKRGPPPPPTASESTRRK